MVDDDPPPPKSLKASKRRAVLDEDEDEDEPRSRRNKRRYEEDDDEDDEDEPPRKRKKSGRRKGSHNGGWHSARIGTLVGSIFCILLFSTLAYFSYHSDHRRAERNTFVCVTAAVFSFIGVGRALLGTVAEDE